MPHYYMRFPAHARTEPQTPARSNLTCAGLPACNWTLVLAIRSLRASAFFLCSVVIAVLLSYEGPAQDLGKTLNVSCGGKFAAKDVKSSVLISPRNESRAYSEVSVTASAGNCANSSRLFVQSPSSGKDYNLVFLQEPTEMQRGNGIRMVDWSSDGRSLLFEVILWQYGSDAGPQKDILIYDSRDGVFSRLGLDDFIGHFGESCLVTVNPLGFSPNDQPILEITAKQDYDEEGHPLSPACNEQKGLWSYDRSSYKMKALASGTVVQRWGTIPAQPEIR